MSSITTTQAAGFSIGSIPGRYFLDQRPTDQLFDILPNFIDDWVDSRAAAGVLSSWFGSAAIPTVNGIGIVFLVGLIIGAAIVILRRMT